MSVVLGDCVEVMRGMDECSVDAVCCDPPYLIDFMGKDFDRQHHMKDGANRGQKMQSWHDEWAAEAFRVLKPSHYILAFGGCRSWHRLACAIEDAGFECRDTLMYLFGSGFPKGKASLKPAYEPIILARKPGPMRELGIEECRVGTPLVSRGGPAGLTPDKGWNDNHMGAHDPKLVAGRWPANLILECTCAETREGTARTGTAGKRTGQNGVGNWGYGAAVVGWGSYGGSDGKEPVRIHTDPNCPCAMLDGQTPSAGGAPGSRDSRGKAHWDPATHRDSVRRDVYQHSGDSGGASRFFLNVKGDSCDANTAAPSSCPLSGFDASALSDAATLAARVVSGQDMAVHSVTAGSMEGCARCTQTPNPALCAAMLASIGITTTTPSPSKSAGSAQDATDANTNSGSSARGADGNGPESVTRFLYSAKASRSERNKGCEGMEERQAHDDDWVSKNRLDQPCEGKRSPQGNHHPTVKPVALMRWLVRLVARPGDVVLDPFAGSGTTGVACAEEGREFIGIEQDAEYVEISRRRIEAARRRVEAASSQTRLPVE